MRYSFDHIRNSVRSLRRNKRFATLAILSLGIAIALNTTMYSVLDALIDPKLAMYEPDRLVFAEYYGDWKGVIPRHEKNEAIRALSFHEAVAGFRGSWAWANDFIERGSNIRDARVVAVTPNYFTVIGVRASAGRLIGQGDTDVEPSPIVLSERMWQRLFPERKNFDTATVLLNATPRLVVGLLPYEADAPGVYTDVWELPSKKQLAEMSLNLFRLKPNATIDQARAELHTLTLRFAERTREYPPWYGFNAQPWLKRQFIHWSFNVALIGAVVAVLLIACANLANLQLARGVSRSKELATRAAIGATRRDLVFQLVMEATWLALGGLLAGAVLTAWGMHLVATSVPDTLAEYVTRPQTSWRVVGVSIVTTIVSLVLVGVLPAIKVSRVDVNELLKSGTGTGQSRRARQQYGVLVVAEVALALALVAGASLLFRAALKLHEDVPADEKQLLHSSIGIAVHDSMQRPTLRAWSDRIAQRVATDADFVNVATEHVEIPVDRAVSIDDPGGAPVVTRTTSWFYSVVSPDYLRTMKMRVTSGRDFTPGEFAEPVVIVDQFTARKLWKGVDPVGRLIKLGMPQSDAPWLRVVGVASVVPSQWGVSRAEAAEMLARAGYLGEVFVLNAADTVQLSLSTPSRRYTGFLQLRVRGTGDPKRLSLQLKRALEPLSPQAFAFRIERWDQRGRIQQRARYDFIAALFGVFGFVSLVLAALGVYAVISHTVAQRTREFGVRIAVGAGAKDIERMVLYDGSILTLLGIAIGLVVIARGSEYLRAFLHGDYDRYDPVLFAFVSLALFLVAWCASYIPARRATRINPVEALRND